MTKHEKYLDTSLNIISWNIHGIRDKVEGIKHNIPSVNSLLSKHDLICLQETKEAITLSNYHCFNSNRTDSKSGGVCIAVRKELAKGATRVSKVSSQDFVTVKLESRFFNLDRDINLLCVYDSPSFSSYKRRKMADEDNYTSTLDELYECITNIPLSEDIVLVGDMNARTSLLDDGLPHDEDPCDIDIMCHSSNYRSSITDRNNMDRSTNPRGKPFIEFLQATGLRILNGRTIGDIFGQPTCYQPNGSSTVDYVCCTARLTDRFRYLKIGNHTTSSDHRPISFSIDRISYVDNLHIVNPDDFEDVPRPHRWNHIGMTGDQVDPCMLFQQAQQNEGHQKSLQDLLNSTPSNAAEVHAFNEKTTLVLNELAKEISTCSSSRNPRQNPNQQGIRKRGKMKWFDRACYISKHRVSSSGAKLNGDPLNGSISVNENTGP